TAFVNQALQRRGLFQRVEILALDVFDQSNRHGGFIGDRTDHGRHSLQADDTRRTPAPFTGDDFVTLIAGAHYQRLYNALRANGLRQRLQRLFVHFTTWLVAAWAELLECDFLQTR